MAQVHRMEITRRTIYSTARGRLSGANAAEKHRYTSRVLATRPQDSAGDAAGEAAGPSAAGDDGKPSRKSARAQFRKVGQALIEGAAAATLRMKTTDVFWKSTHEKAMKRKVASAANLCLALGDWESFAGRLDQLLDDCKQYKVQRCVEQYSEEAEETLSTTKQAVLSHFFAETNLRKTLKSFEKMSQLGPEAQQRLLVEAAEAQRLTVKAQNDLQGAILHLSRAGPHGSNKEGDLEAQREARKTVLDPVPEDALDRIRAIAEEAGADDEDEEEMERAIEVEMEPLGATASEVRQISQALREEVFEKRLHTALSQKLSPTSGLMQELDCAAQQGKAALEQQGFKVDLQDQQHSTVNGAAENVSQVKPSMPALPKTMAKAAQPLRGGPSKTEARSPKMARSPSPTKVDAQQAFEDSSAVFMVDSLDTPAQQSTRGFRADKLRRAAGRAVIVAKLSGMPAKAEARRRSVVTAASVAEPSLPEPLDAAPAAGRGGDAPLESHGAPEGQQLTEGQRQDKDGAASIEQGKEARGTSTAEARPEDLVPQPVVATLPQPVVATLPRRASCAEPDFSALMMLALQQLGEAVVQQWSSVRAASEDLSTCGGDVGGSGRIGVSALHQRLAASGYQRSCAEVCAMFRALGVPSTEGTTLSIDEFMRLSAPSKWCEQPVLARAAGLLRALELRRVLMVSLRGPEMLLARLHAALVQLDDAMSEAGHGGAHSMRRHTRTALTEALSSWARALATKGHHHEQEQQHHHQHRRLATDFARTATSAKGLRVFADVVASHGSTASHKDTAMSLLARALSLLGQGTAAEVADPATDDFGLGPAHALTQELRVRFALEFWSPIFDALDPAPGEAPRQLHPLLSRELAAWHLLLMQASIPLTVAGRFAEQAAPNIAAVLHQLARAASHHGSCDVGAMLQALMSMEQHGWCERPPRLLRQDGEKDSAVAPAAAASTVEKAASAARGTSQAEQARMLIVAFCGRPILQTCLAILPKDGASAEEARSRGEAALASWDDALRKIQARWPAPSKQQAHITGPLATIAALSKAVALAQREGFETRWPDFHEVHKQAQVNHQAHEAAVAYGTEKEEAQTHEQPDSEEEENGIGIEQVVLRRLEARSEQMRRKKLDRKIQLAAATPRPSLLRDVLSRRASGGTTAHVGEMPAPLSCRIHYKTKTAAVRLPPLPLAQQADEVSGAEVPLTAR